MRALVEEVSASLGAITLLLDAWYMKGYLIVDVLTRDAIVIGQVRHDTALYEPPPPRTGKPGCYSACNIARRITDFTGVLKAHGIRISLDGKGRCLDNIFVERLWRSLKYEDIVCCERFVSAWD